MRPSFLVPAASILAAAHLAAAHGAGHAHGASYDDHGAEVGNMGYAERHMRSEHHIDAFDPESFFHLHDLDHDGVLNVEEIEAIYGLHHDSSKAASKTSEAQAAKAKIVTTKVLDLLDKDGDRVVTLSEFLALGSEGLPDFKGFEDLGHHYDEESEYFLHHEELYHSTPETQTDDSYTHPEDLEHFAHHEEIEAKEDARAQTFLEGESVTHGDLPHEQQKEHQAPPKQPSIIERLGKERIAAQTQDGVYGEGAVGYQRPKTTRDKLRRGTPYKYKFRRSPKEF